MNCHRVDGSVRRAKGRIFLAIAWLALCCGELSEVAQAQSSGPAPGSNRLESVLIAVVPQGFAPKTLSLKPGVYHIVILNRTGFRGLNFEFDQIASHPDTGAETVQSVLLSGQTTGAAEHLSQTITLAPGVYRLRVPAHPTWICTFQVQ